MSSNDYIERIAEHEANETFQSITDLDGIGDTCVVAITFVLSALAVWTTFALDRLSETGVVRWFFFALVLLCVGSIVLSTYYLIRALFPRYFYTENVGSVFLPHRMPFPGRDTANEDYFVADRDDDLLKEFEQWLDNYHPAEDVESIEQFHLSRFYHYKHVARIKAKMTAYGLAWLRISIGLLGLSVVIGLLAPYFC